MNLQSFFDNFALLADAPNGVPKLRELILQLAVRGSLGTQEPTDEPALTLLEKILGKTETRSFSQPNNVPFPLPDSWLWIRFGDIYDIQGGTQPPKSEFVATPTKGYVRLLQIRDFGPRPEPVYIKQDSVTSFCTTTDVMLARYGASVGKVFMGQDGAYNVALTKLIFDHDRVYNRFVYYLLKSTLFQTWLRPMSRSAQAGFNKGNIHPIPLPFPPIQEQKRIVAKVDELMRLCDELEAQQQAKRKSRLRLNNATLAPLNNAASIEPEEFEQASARLADNFAMLYDSVETVGKLRSTILQLAVQGKLVPQNPQAVPAGIDLKAIEAERTATQEKQRKKKMEYSAVSPAEAPFTISSQWRWVHLGELASLIEYGTSEKASFHQDGVPVFRMNNIDGGRVLHSNLKYVSPAIKDLPRLYLQTNELLFNRTNSFDLVGKTGIFKGDSNKFTFASYLIRIRLFERHTCPEYVNLAMNAEYFRQTQINTEVTQQCGQANFNGTKLGNVLIPLPPLEEQKRIVAKVNQLLALCDELENELRQVEADSEKLMNAAVQHVLDSITTSCTKARSTPIN